MQPGPGLREGRLAEPAGRNPAPRGRRGADDDHRGRRGRRCRRLEEALVIDGAQYESLVIREYS